MSDNRIGNPCWWKKIDLKEGTHEWRAGTLRFWGTDFEELNDGIGQFPVGVVEDNATALVHSTPVHHLSFDTGTNPDAK